MTNDKKTITLQGIVDGKIVDLMPDTTTDNVYLEDGSNLTDKLAELGSGGSGSSSWDSVMNKPFKTLGDGLSVDENGVLSAVGSIAERNITLDVLWDEIIDSAGTYTLTKSIDDYDFLIASAWGWTSSNTYEQSNYIIIPKKDYYIRSTEGVGWAFCINTSFNAYNRRCIFQFDDNVTLNIVYQETSKFRALYGVKLGSGGSGGSGSGITTEKAYKYIKFNITQVYGTSVGLQIQLSEIKLYKNGVHIPFPEGTICSSNMNGNSGETIENIIDGNTDTKYCSNLGSPHYIYFEFPEPIAFDSYSYISASDSESYPGRNPISWTLLGSEDEVHYSILSMVDDAPIPETNTTESMLFKIYENTTFDNKISNGNIYSTEEQVIGTWIDGKPIYRKAYYVNSAFKSGSDVDFTAYIPNFSEMDTLVKAFGYKPYNKGFTNIQGYINSNKLILHTDWGLSLVEGNPNILILEYTKTTN